MLQGTKYSEENLSGHVFVSQNVLELHNSAFCEQQVLEQTTQHVFLGTAQEHLLPSWLIQSTVLFLFQLQLSGTVTIPWWQWFLTRFGKKMATYCGILVRSVLWTASELNKSCISLTLVSAPAVGGALHDPHRLRQEQPDHFLPGVGGSRCECGSIFPPAVVSTSLTLICIICLFCSLSWAFFWTFVFSGRCSPTQWTTSKLKTRTSTVTKLSSTRSTCSSSSSPPGCPWVFPLSV